MSYKRLPLVVAIACVVAAGAFAQQGNATGNQSGTSRGGTLSIEDLYLSQEVEVQLLRTQALSPLRENKLLALQNIRTMIEEKRVSPDSKEVMIILDALAGEGVYRISRQNGEVSNYFPDVRREAVQLLARIGGRVAKETLIKVAMDDKEPMVLAEAVYGLALMATENDKDIIPYLTKVITRNNVRATPDNNLAYACLLAIERLAEKFKGITDAEMINALLDVASGIYLRDVRLKAIDVIARLRPKAWL